MREPVAGETGLSRPRGSGFGRAFQGQLRVELRLLLRQPENLLVILVLPVLILVFFASFRVLPSVRGRPIDFLVPGVLTLAVMSTGMVTLGISTAYQRYYRVLKRLGGTPLSRFSLVLAKATSVALVEVGQIVLIVLIAHFAFGWSGRGSWWLAVVLLLVGSFTFAAIGLTLAGALRAELTLGGANGLYLVFLILGGIALPVRQLPGVVQPVARVLPAAALSSSLRSVMQGHPPGTSSWVLAAAWAVAAGILATTLFRWE